MDEQLLIKQCERHQRQAQKMLFDTYYPNMFRLARRYLVNFQDAEDVLALSFIRVFDKITVFEYRGDGSLGKWISTIVIHECIRFLSRQKPLLLEDDMGKLAVEYGSAHIPSDMEAGDIQRVIDQLPDGYRVVFNLFAIEGYSHNEIAGMLHISEGTSRSQLSKARNHIIEKLNKEALYGTA